MATISVRRPLSFWAVLLCLIAPSAALPASADALDETLAPEADGATVLSHWRRSSPPPDPWQAEFTRNYSLAQIRAGSAYARQDASGRALTGYGQTVAVFDTGINASHPEFTGRLSSAAGYDAINGTFGVTTDPNGHGTFVSGIIAANRDGVGMMGIAYEAKILPVRIANPNGSITLSDANLAAGIRYATTQGVRVFNNSWNSSTSIQSLSKATIDGAFGVSIQAWEEAVAAGAVIVFAAGNDGKSQPGFFAALPAHYSQLGAGWISAAATDSRGRIAYYSNRCGATAAYCLAAPGSSINSTYGSGYGTGSGTSFAAPAVAAAAAILYQEFPYLSNAEILEILFTSANKSGKYANSAVYGQGLLDLDKATQPIGTLTVATSPTVSGPSTPATTSGFWFSGAFGRGAIRSVADVPLMVLDDFKRSYAVSLASVFSAGQDSFDALEAVSSFAGHDVVSETAANMTLSYATNGTGQFLFRQKSDNVTVEWASDLSAGLLFGSYAEGALDRFSLVRSDSAGFSYLDLADEAQSLAITRPLGHGAALRVGSFIGASLADRYKPEDLTRPIDPQAVHGALAEVMVKAWPRTRLLFHGGLVNERATLLGSESGTAFRFGADNRTYFMGASGVADLGLGLTLFGGMELGRTEPASPTGFLIQSISPIASQSWHVGVQKSGLLAKNDRLGFVASEPLRVVAGEAQLTVPLARDLDGNVFSAPVSMPLAADGRELDLQGFYKTPLGQRTELAFGALVRLEPGHEQGAAADAILMSAVRFRL